MATYTDNDIRNCKLIGILVMVHLQLVQIQAEKHLDEQTAVENIAQSYEEFVARCRDLFPTNELFYSGIKAMARDLGMDMEMEKIDGYHDQGINRVC